MENSITESYYKFIQEKYNCQTSEELLGKKYSLPEAFGKGNFTMMQIEEGIDLARSEADGIEFNFNNKKLTQGILELGYCYSGELIISTSPGSKQYKLKAGDSFIYKMLNKVNSFKFEYNNLKAISIHLNFALLKENINQSWSQQLVKEWQQNMAEIFTNDILLINKSTYQLQQLAEEIDKISVKNMLDYLRLKVKTIEFITDFLQEKLRLKANKTEEVDYKQVAKAKAIIKADLENVPSVDDLAASLKVSNYILQKNFKQITGDTVYKYVQQVRVKEAEYLLKNTDKSILEITHQVGYHNPSKFANLFKKYYQLTPLKYRKLVLN